LQVAQKPQIFRNMSFFSERLKKQAVETERFLRPKLNPQQLHALQLVREGKSVFVSGSAGVGKSLLMRYLVSFLRIQKGLEAVAVTASTGVAAIQVNGITIHRWASVGLVSSDTTIGMLMERVRKSYDAQKRWSMTQVLIIDEISMLSAEVFSLLSQVGCRMRRKPAPFGGLQGNLYLISSPSSTTSSSSLYVVICCGDFLQLPPVHGKHAFRADEWNILFPKERCVMLTRIYRQTDQQFMILLDLIRRGKVSQEQLDIINKTCCNNVKTKDGIVSTKVFCANVSVDKQNQQELARLGGSSIEFSSVDVGCDLKSQRMESLESDDPIFKSNTMFAPAVTLKLNAQVMLLANLDQDRGLVNGSRGVIVSFTKKSASSDPKSQKSPHIKEWFQRNGDRVPVVKFVGVGAPVEVDPREGSITTQKRYAERIQIPLALSWACTSKHYFLYIPPPFFILTCRRQVHKSQGMTIDRASIDLSRSFEEGQAYTALSRVRTMASLQLLAPLDMKNILFNQEVVEYYDKIMIKK
jgi:ATP-dependent DNA helicase PIF1